jgi:poly-gamma-glutamate capsule biosynthesis protein CapA/YwtB (metallophosphatase superfamily)
MLTRSCILSLVFGLILASSAPANDAIVEPGFVSLFDGKTLDGWEGNLTMFRVEEGAIIAGTHEHNIPNNEFLCSRKQFGNFELRLQARLRGAGNNAGVQFRSQRIPNHHEVSGYQCDIGMMQDKPIWGWLYDESRRKKFLVEADAEKLGKVVKQSNWNDIVIRCFGPRVELWVNGLKTVDYTEEDSSIARHGIIGLQIHAGAPAEAAYRNIRIKRLAAGDALAVEEALSEIPERLLPVTATAEDLMLIYAGDIMLADLPGKAMARGVDPFQEFAGVLSGADATIGNLECVVATKGDAVPKPWVFRANPAVLPVLKKHFGIVSLANNHTGDFGHDAFSEQLDLLEQNKIAYFGGGRNCAHARMPHLVTIKGQRLALLGYNEFKPRSFEAGPDWPGVAWSVDEQVVMDIRAARTRHHADLVIPYMHWGWENEPANNRQKKLARLMIDAGADMVIGGHPHVTQEVEYYQGKLIVYSLGNYVFDGFEEGPSRVGWLVRLRMNKKGLVAWDTVVAHMDAEGIPHLEKETSSPSGSAGVEKIEDRRALVDSPLTSFRK